MMNRVMIIMARFITCHPARRTCNHEVEGSPTPLWVCVVGDLDRQGLGTYWGHVQRVWIDEET